MLTAIIILSILIILLFGFIIFGLNKYVKNLKENAKNLSKIEILEHDKQTSQNNLNLLKSELKSEFKNISYDALSLQEERAHNKLKESLKPYTDKVQQFSDELKKLDENHKLNFSNLNSEFTANMKNIKITADSFNIAAEKFSSALKASSKIQGDLGEEILNQILMALGFQEGIHYEKQLNSKNIDIETNHIYDIVINLPTETGNKSYMIIDSKTPLNSYINWANAESKLDQDKHAKEFIKNLRNNINILSKKEYHLSNDSQDFIILFIPFENAINLINKYDSNLIYEATKKNICISTPSTLIITLKLVLSILSRYKNIANSKDIMKLGNEILTFATNWLNNITKIEKSTTELLGNINKMKSDTNKKTNISNIINKMEVNGFKSKTKLLKNSKNQLNENNEIIEIHNVIDAEN